MLAEVFFIIAPLDPVPEQARVCAVEEPSLPIECQPEDVSSPFAEQLEVPRHGMIAPDSLLEFDPADATGRRAAVEPIEPAVGAPREMVGQRLGIFDPESVEQNLRVAVWGVIAVTIGIKEEVRDLDDVDSAIAEFDAGAQIQPAHKIAEAIGTAVAVRVFKNRDPVGAAGTMRRRLGFFVVDRSRIA